MRSDQERDALEHIRDNITIARHFIDVFDLTGFLNDPKTFYAATRCLEIISEASRRLSSELKQRHPQIPWKAIAGSGSIYRHDYEDVLERRVWDTIHEGLPPLFHVIMAELRRLETS